MIYNNNNNNNTFHEYMAQSMNAERDLADVHLADVHLAVAAYEQARAEAAEARRQERAQAARSLWSANHPIGRDPTGAAPAPWVEPITREARDKQLKQEKAKMDTHNDTLTALHVRQGTKFCGVLYRNFEALDQPKVLEKCRKIATEQTHDSGRTWVYKHTMDLELGAVVIASEGTAVVVELDATPKFGEGIAYKWIVADITTALTDKHAVEAREKEAVEAMATEEAMAAATRVLDALGVTNADKAAALLAPPTA